MSESKILSLFKLALQHFYPKKHQEIDNVQYKSKKEMYEEWFDSSYINGSWYIGEELPPVISTIERSIDTIFYMIDTEYRYYLGFKINCFKSNQIVKVTIKIVKDGNHFTYDYNAKLFEKDKNYVYLELDDEITPSNIKRISLEADEVIENHIKYSAVSKKNFDNPTIIEATKSEYDTVRKNNIILQKPKQSIQVIRYTQERNNETEYGLRFRNILPPYYDENQTLHYELNITEAKGSKPISNNFSVCCFSQSMNEAEVIITVYPYEEYSGYKVKLKFNEINGRSYTNPYDIEYIE